MSRRSRPHYHSGLEWILGVAFEDTLTRPARLAQRFTHVRCCGSPRASSPHGLAAPALASRDGRDCVQLPPARGCYHLAPRRTFTSNPAPMPGTPMPAPLSELARAQARIAELERKIGRQQVDLDFFREALRLIDARDPSSRATPSTRARRRFARRLLSSRRGWRARTSRGGPARQDPEDRAAKPLLRLSAGVS